jgi:hypothetical protein
METPVIKFNSQLLLSVETSKLSNDNRLGKLSLPQEGRHMLLELLALLKKISLN